MPIISSSDPNDQIYVSQYELTNRVIADFLPDKFSSPASSYLFNNTPEGQKYDRIKYLSLTMAMMYIARLTRPDLATKCQQPTTKIDLEQP